MTHEPARVELSADQDQVPPRVDPPLRLVEPSAGPGRRFADHLADMSLRALVVGYGLGLLAAVCVIAAALV